MNLITNAPADINLKTSSLVQLDNLLKLCEKLEYYEQCASIKNEINKRVAKHEKFTTT